MLFKLSAITFIDVYFPWWLLFSFLKKRFVLRSKTMVKRESVLRANHTHVTHYPLGPLFKEARSKDAYFNKLDTVNLLFSEFSPARDFKIDFEKEV